MKINTSNNQPATRESFQLKAPDIPNAQGTFDALPYSAMVREAELVRSSKCPASAVAPLPFSAPTLWRKVKAGTFPKPTKLSARVTAWQVGQVREWLAAQAAV